jgi:hypothetical protein
MKKQSPQIELIEANIRSYQELIKDMERLAVMARLQGRQYSQEAMVYAARHHLQKLRERHQALIQRYPQSYVRAADESTE